MIKEINGDILNSSADIIVQQVNCRNVMGAGLAKAIYHKWPNVKSEYHKFCMQYEPGDLLGKVLYVDVTSNQIVANVFGQLDYGRKNFVYTNYSALDYAFEEMSKKYSDKSFAFPYGFGCGLANGDWKIVYNMICRYFKHIDTTIYKI